MAEARLLVGPAEEVERVAPGGEPRDDGFYGGSGEVGSEAAKALPVAGGARAREFVEQVVGEVGRGSGRWLCCLWENSGEGLEEEGRRGRAGDAPESHRDGWILRSGVAAEGGRYAVGNDGGLSSFSFLFFRLKMGLSNGG